MTHAHLRDELDLAWECVRTGKAPQALVHLKGIQSEIEDLAGSAFPAEYALTYACALAAKRDGDAETAFTDAVREIVRLTDNQELQMRAHEEFGKFLAKRGAFARARSELLAGWRIAECLDPEDAARLLKYCMKAELAERKDPRLKAFENLEEAAKGGYSCQEQCDVWFEHGESLTRSGERRLAARNGGEASVEYFRRRLDAAKRRGGEGDS